MEVETLQLGPYQTNCYLLHNDSSVWIIDPGFDGASIFRHITSKGWKAEAVILTHSHWDHVLGIPGLLAQDRNIPVYVHALDAPYLGKEGGRRLRQLAISLDPSQSGVPNSLWESLPEPTHRFVDRETIVGCGLHVLHIGGHTPGSVALYRHDDNLLFSGDTLFAGSIGRTDLPDSDPQAIVPAIKTKLMTLPGNTTVYPGHGRSTTILREKGNPWL